MGNNILLDYGHFSNRMAGLLDRNKRIDMVYGGQRLYASVWRGNESVLLPRVEKDVPHTLNSRLDLRRWEMIVVISIVASMITSGITTKVLAARYFKIVDSYVKDMCDLTNRSNESTMAIVRRLEQCVSSKEREEGTRKKHMWKRG